MKSLMYLNKYFYKYKGLMLFGILFVAISNIIAIYPAQIFRDAIDTVIESIKVVKAFEGSSLGDSFESILVKSFFFFGACVLGLALLKGIFTFLMRQTIIVMSRKIEFDLKNEIFNKYQLLDIGFYKQNKVGDIMNRISEDVSAVRMYIGPAIMYTVNLIVLFVVVIYTMFSINVELSWYTLIPLPVMSVLIYYVSDLMNRKSKEKQEQLSNVFSQAQEHFSGIRVVKAYNQVEPSEIAFEEECQRFFDKSMSLVKVNAAFHPIIILLPALSTLITIYIGGLKVIEGEITYGNIAEFVIYINMLTWPMASLGWVTSLVQRAAASQERINEFLKIPSQIDYSGNWWKDLQGEIEFSNVSYTYPESGIVGLKDISFKILPGETLGVIGRTGSGKSTIAALLLRVIEPDSGEIFIDGKNLKEIDIKKFRSKIGYVPQEVFLFSDTIRNNIAFGDVEKESKSEEVENAAKLAVVHKNIASFEKGYETKVGERGVTLSGGQKQRVSIARALLKKPEILILDDCLSAVDTETEDEILKNFNSVMHGKSAIVIAHRVSSIKQANKIIVLDKGEMVESGNHDRLLSEKGLYYEFYQKQLVRDN